MKFTNEYIEMVGKAEEIQKNKEWNAMRLGSFAIIKGEFHDNEITTWDKLSYYGDDYKDECEIIAWLPTLDDLFEILKGDVIATLDSFYDWVVVDCTNVILLNNFVDIKEFLLCYVMFENYSKLWGFDKKQWEAIK